MATITLKVNEKSKVGKAFYAMLELFLNQPGIEIVEEKSPYNPKFVEKILKSQKEIKQGKYKTLDTNDIWGSLGL